MILAIDAHNIRKGGGLTYLVNLIDEAHHLPHFRSIHIMGGSITYDFVKDHIGNSVNFHLEPLLNGNLIKRQYWHRFILPRRLEELKTDILLSPGGLLPSYWPRGVKTVAMNQNILPFMFSDAQKDGLKLLARRLLQKHFQLRSYRRADGVIFLSEFTRNIISNAIPNISQKSVIIPHGANKTFRRNTTNKGKKPEKQINLLYVSSIKSYKYQWNIVKAMSLLPEELCNNIRLILLGSADAGPLKKLETTIEKYNMRDKIKWLRWVDGEDLVKLYHSASIFVFPSTCEACPCILLEAMASGLPIACSNRASMPEFAKDGVRYIDPEDPNSIANAIAYLIDNPEYRKKLSLRALELSENCTWKICAKKTFDFLRRVSTKHGTDLRY